MSLSAVYQQLPSRFNLVYFQLCKNLKQGSYGKVAFYENEKTHTYGSLLSYVKKFANYFVNNRLQKNSKVGILLSDELEFVISFFGAVWTDVVLANIRKQLKTKRPKYKIPEKLIILYEFPRTAADKINYNNIVHTTVKEIL